MHKPKIYDCFCFFNEEMLLKLRLETLWNYVDYFVISEATYTHKGAPREPLFDISKFSKYKSKIRYQLLETRPHGENDFWKNENHIRNNLKSGLQDAAPHDFIIVSDLDEIPNPKSIYEYNPRFIRGDFLQNYYSYYLNNLWVDKNSSDYGVPSSPMIWRGSKITTGDHFRHFFRSNATSVRNYKSRGPLRSIKRWWFEKKQIQEIKNGGWHFTWVLSLDDILKKMESTAHTFDDPRFKDKAYLSNQIESQRDFQDPNKVFQITPIDESFPKPLRIDGDVYSAFIKKINE